MNKSETIGELTKALVSVQKGLQPAKKDSANPFFKSKYADLNSIWDSCRDLLATNGLAVMQTNEPVENAVIVETTLAHQSGEWVSGQILLPLAKSDAQGVGSAITYGRRYGLAAILGIVSDEDDDGNAASPQKKTESKGVQMATSAQLALIKGKFKTGDEAQAFVAKMFPEVKGPNDLTFEQATALVNQIP